MTRRMIDISGQVFGYLTAIEPTKQRSGHNIVWLCSCNCGSNTCAKFVYVTRSNLFHQHTNSCRKQQYSKTIHRTIRTHFSNTRTNAKKRNYTFELTLEQFHYLIKQPCYYCGGKDIRPMYDRGVHKWNLRANGIDRLDNTMGYIIDNCVSCCGYCNIAKGSKLPQEYIKHCAKVCQHQESKKHDGN